MTQNLSELWTIRTDVPIFIERTGTFEYVSSSDLVLYAFISAIGIKAPGFSHNSGYLWAQDRFVLGLDGDSATEGPPRDSRYLARMNLIMGSGR